MSKRQTSLQYLKYAETFKTYHPMDVIFREGDIGKHMFVIKTGTVELRVAQRAIEILSTGEIFGEMAMLDAHKRSATAIAMSECQIVPIDEARFLYMVRQTPYFAIEVMQIMAQRLRNMNQRNSAIIKPVTRDKSE